MIVPTLPDSFLFEPQLTTSWAACARIPCVVMLTHMQEPNLYSIRVYTKKLYKKDSLLKQEFSASCPNQIWVSDIMYFKVWGHWVYLCIILDLYSQKIVSWRVLRHINTHLVTATFKRAFQERGNPKNLTLHSDRGSRYISKTFASLLQQCSVNNSFRNGKTAGQRCRGNISLHVQTGGGISEALYLRTAFPAEYSRVYSVLQ